MDPIILSQAAYDSAFNQGVADCMADRTLVYRTVRGVLRWAVEDEMGLTHEEREAFADAYIDGWQSAANCPAWSAPLTASEWRFARAEA